MGSVHPCFYAFPDDGRAAKAASAKRWKMKKRRVLVGNLLGATILLQLGQQAPGLIDRRRPRSIVISYIHDVPAQRPKAQLLLRVAGQTAAALSACQFLLRIAEHVPASDGVDFTPRSRIWWRGHSR
jgi:hypothetical protein